MLRQKTSSDGAKVYSDAKIEGPLEFKVSQVLYAPICLTSPLGNSITVESCQSLVDCCPEAWYRISCCLPFRRLWPNEEFCRIWPEPGPFIDPRSYPFEAHWLDPPSAGYRCRIYHIDRNSRGMRCPTHETHVNHSIPRQVFCIVHGCLR